MRPRIAVFYGGESANNDLSTETGMWVCQYVPRGQYDVTPVEVTSDGSWKVPLGNLPRSGSVTTTMKRLSEAVPAQKPAQAMNRLLSRPLDGIFTLVRGHGGDDGALHSFGSLVGAAVTGSPLSTCQQTSDKYAFSGAVSDIVDTPYVRKFSRKQPLDSIVADIQSEFLPPFFLKPAAQEGSVGIEKIESLDSLHGAVSRITSVSDIIAQEYVPGREYAVSVTQDAKGRTQVLPATEIQFQAAPFYDRLGKRIAGRANIRAAESSPVIQELQEIAHDIYEELGCRGVVTIDFVVNGDAISVLEANTVPTLSSHTPLVHQLKAASLHPGLLLDSALRNGLEEH